MANKTKKQALIDTVKSGLEKGAKVLQLNYITPSSKEGESDDVRLIKGEQNIKGQVAYITKIFDDNLQKVGNEKVSISDVKMHTNDLGLF